MLVQHAHPAISRLIFAVQDQLIQRGIVQTALRLEVVITAQLLDPKKIPGTHDLIPCSLKPCE